MRNELFIVLGNGQTGKSVTIRGLTGMTREGKCDLETDNDDIDIYVLIRALQEAKLTPNAAVVKYGKYEKLLIPLHFSSSYGTAVDYIRIFIEAGFTVSRIVALDRNRNALDNLQTALPQLPEIQYINIPEDIRDMPNNRAAHQIREVWDWF